jgi:hypothetical protein
MGLPLTVLCDGRALSPHQVTFGNVDPGGYQVLSLKAPGADLIAVDTPVRVLLGADTAWHGLVNEPGAATRDTRTDDELAAIGYGARLRDNPFSMIYVDSAFAGWKGAGTQRRINLIGINFGTPTDPAARTDSGTPAVATEITGAWTSTSLGISEAWYDAGPGNTIDSLYYAWTKGSNVDTASSWTWAAYLSLDDTASNLDTSGNLKAAGPGTGTLTATETDRRYVIVNLFHGGAHGDDNKPYGIDWTCLTVYGNHGLPLRGSASATQGYGLYPHEVWMHALRRSGAGILPGRVDDASSYLIRQLVYKEAPQTGAEQIHGDLAKLMGWHTGVWAPASAFDDTPRADFCAPPTGPTCMVYRRECDQFDSPKIRRDSLYTRADVRYTDAAGSLGVETVELPSDLIEGDRTLQLNMGTGSAASARAFGRFALLLARDSARGSGSCTVRDTVMLPGGGRKPAMLLRAGRDRIQIPDLPDSGSFTGPRRDTFLVRRVETTVSNGTASTRIEFDGGADLLEVLQARTASALEAANL